MGWGLKPCNCITPPSKCIKRASACFCWDIYIFIFSNMSTSGGRNMFCKMRLSDLQGTTTTAGSWSSSAAAVCLHRTSWTTDVCSSTSTLKHLKSQLHFCCSMVSCYCVFFHLQVSEVHVGPVCGDGLYSGILPLWSEEQ